LYWYAGLQCYICDSASHVSYSDAETTCNVGNLRQCPDTTVRESTNDVQLLILLMTGCYGNDSNSPHRRRRGQIVQSYSSDGARIICTASMIPLELGTCETAPKRHLDRFSRCCRAYWCDRQTDRQTQATLPQDTRRHSCNVIHGLTSLY